MIGKIGRFFEEHIEKMILIVVGLICIWLFITRVLFSPNVVEYQSDGKTEKLSPGVIDSRINEEASILSQILSREPVDVESYTPKVNEFLAQMDSAIVNIDSDLMIPNPANVRIEVTSGPYNLPQIGSVTDVAVEHIRAAAYIPVESVTATRTYDQVKKEPGDIDLVTIEAKFDIATLFERFDDSFRYNVPEQWADPCLAKPVFAAVNLQRQQLNNDGTWSQWQDVPRSKIESNRQFFQTAEKAESRAIKLLKLQFDIKQVQIDLLQPPSYRMASAEEEWLPPLLHQRYLDALNKEQRQERLDARDAERESTVTTEQRTTARTRRTTAGSSSQYNDSAISTTPGSRQRITRRSDTVIGQSETTEGTLRSPRLRTRETTVDDSTETIDESTETIAPTEEVISDFYQIMLTETTDFSKLREPITFWAHDDTVEPGKSYRYRIRLGVFNPVAGGDKNDGILWSDFSNTTRSVEIPGMLYFFARDAQEAAKTVTIAVYRYKYGYWRRQVFSVGLGEVIGNVVEPEPEEETDFSMVDEFGRPIASTTSTVDLAVEPDSIDFNTGAILLDFVMVDDWSGVSSLRYRKYNEILYSYDGVTIERIPIGSGYWPLVMQNTFNSLESLSKVDKESFKSWSSSVRSTLIQ